MWTNGLAQAHDVRYMDRENLFVYTSRIAASAERVFRWDAEPGALARLTPPWEKMEVVGAGAGNSQCRRWRIARASRSDSRALEIRAQRLPGRAAVPRRADGWTIPPVAAHAPIYSGWLRRVPPRRPYRLPAPVWLVGKFVRRPDGSREAAADLRISAPRHRRGAVCKRPRNAQWQRSRRR